MSSKWSVELTREEDEVGEYDRLLTHYNDLRITSTSANGNNKNKNKSVSFNQADSTTSSVVDFGVCSGTILPCDILFDFFNAPEGRYSIINEIIRYSKTR